MPRDKQELPKPLFDLKSDFLESLSFALQQATNLLTIIETALDNGCIANQVETQIRARAERLREALYGKEGS